MKVCKYDNIIFDFDSTVIRFESLELIMKNLLEGNKQKIQQIKALTNAGMNGEISFRESLESRLKVAAPSRQALKKFVAHYCPQALTSGILQLIQKLYAEGIKIWIISGGFTEIILPFSEVLNIPMSRVYAVNLNWDENGKFKSLNNDNGFCDSKVIGVKKIQDKFVGKTLIVGDGFTDYELFTSGGIADEFIAYTEHVARYKVLKLSLLCAKNTKELSQLILEAK